MPSKNAKRILSVKIKRITDDSPDTSYLGEYSQTPKSEYSIDRAHSEDCASIEANHRQTVDKLERIIGHLDKIRTSDDVASNPDNTEWESLDEAIDTLIALQDGAMACDCSQGGYFDPRGYHVSGHEYRYFNGPVENYTGCTPEEIRQNVHQDFERMERYNAGDWQYIGIGAEAQVQITSDVVQRIHSGGLWGIESDSGDVYLESVEQEELASLKSELKALGFSSRAISQAFKSIKEMSE